MSAVVEYFTLRDALARVSREPAELRDRRRALLARARQRRHAADTLWIANQPAEALPLLVSAFALYRELVLLDGAAEPEGATEAGAESGLAEEEPDRLGTRLRELGFTPHEVERIERARSRAESSPLPELHDGTGKADIDLQRTVDDAIAALDEHFESLASTRPRLVMRRAFRTSALALGLTFVVALLGYFAFRPEPLAASASAIYANAPQFAPEKAVDRDPATEWLLPDRTPGYLDVSLPKAREVRAVTLQNGHNPPYDDRAVQAYRIELYDGLRKVGSARGRFERLERSPRPVRIAVHGQHVDRVRIAVESSHGLGAALAEVTVE